MTDQYGGGGQSLIEGGGTGSHKKKKRHPAPSPPPPGPQPREPQQSPGPGGGTQPTAPQAPPYNPPSPSPIPDPVYQYHANNRIQAFPPHIVRDQPFLVASLVYSGMPNDALGRVASGITNAWAWLNQPAQVAARVAALANPVVPGAIPDRRAETAQIEAQNAGDALAAQIAAINAGINVANFPSEAHIAAMQANAEANAKAPRPGYNPYAGTGLTPQSNSPILGAPNALAGPSDSILNYVNNRIYDVSTALAGGDPAINRAYNPDIQQNPEGYAVASEAQAITTPVSAPFAVAGAALHGAGELLDKPHLSTPFGEVRPFHALHAGFDTALRPVSNTFKWVGNQANQAGGMVASSLGETPGTPGYEGIQAVASFLIQWEVGNTIARGSAAFKEARSQPKELLTPGIGRAELRAAAKEAGLNRVHTPSRQFTERHSNTLTGFRGPVAHVQGIISRAIYEMASTPVEGWFTGHLSKGRRFSVDVVKTLDRAGPKEGAGALLETMPGMSPALADDLAGLKPKSWQEVSSYMIERIRKPSEEEVAAKKQLITDLNAKLKANERMYPEERANALVDIAKARKWLDNLQPDEAIFRVPKSSTMRKIQTGTGGRTVRVLNLFYDPVRAPGALNLSRMFDDGPKSDKLWLPGAPGAPADALTQNAGMIDKILHRLGVPDAQVRQVLTRMSKAKTEDDYFRVFTHDLAGAIEDSPRVAPDMKKALTERWKGDISERHKSFRTEELISKEDFTGVPHSADMLTTRNEYEQTIPSVTQESQFTSSVPFIDHELAIEATSYGRRITRALRRTATGGDEATMRAISREAKGSSRYERDVLRAGRKDAAGRQIYTPKALAARGILLPMDLIKGILDTSTAIGKPLTLVTRSLGALWLRIQLEQGLRNFFMGYDPLVLKTGEAWDQARYDNQVMQAAGFIVRDSMEPVNTVIRWKPFEFTNNRLTGDARLEMTDEQLQALHTQFAQAYASPSVKELVTRGPDGFVEWATGDSGGATNFKKRFSGIFDRSNELHGMTWNEQVRWWADQKYAEMQHLAGHDENLLNSIATGKWNVRNAHFEDSVRAGLGKLSQAEEYQGLLDEKAALDQHLAEATDTNVRRAFQDARLEVTEKISDMEAAGLSPDNLAASTVGLDHPDLFIDTLRAEHMQGNYTPPPQVMGTIEGAPNMPKGRLRAADEWRKATQWMLYRGLKTTQWADIKGTRGSLFYQIFRQRFAELAARTGTEDVEYLKTQAMWRAARETAALHYDLAARSSMHRFFKNFFWFLPAYQEVLTTWAVKIPSRYYLPVGLAYEANRVSAALQLMHSLGVITKGPPSADNPKGEDRVVIPGAAQFFNDILPGTPFPTKGPNKTIISFRPSGLNLVAGGLPSVPPVLAIPSGILARKMGGVYKTISDAFTFAGADTSIMPSGINYLIEGLTGKKSFLEPFSDGVLGNIHDSAFDDSLAMAYYTLDQQGIHAPDPNDPKFKTQGQYNNAKEAYYRHWMAEANSMHKGRYLVKAFGATLFPASLSVSSTYRESFLATWWKITGGKALTDGITPEMSAKLENWISSHPGGLAYRVFRNQQGDPLKPLPYDATNINDLYYEGSLKALSPEDFQQRVMVFESNRHFAMERNAIYEGMTAPQVLMSYYKVHKQIDALNGEIEKWNLFNPVEKAKWDAYIASFPDQANKTIVSIVQAKRLQQTIAGLKQLAPMFTSGGIPDANWRKVLGTLQGLYSDTNKDFPAPRTAVEKGIGWYINNVVSPYMERILPLYAKADLYSASGASDQASKIYDQIRHINDTFNSGLIKGPDGLTYPHPEAYFFAHLSPKQQKIRSLHWATEPIGWLTDFQRDHVGYDDGKPLYGKMFDWVTNWTAANVTAYIDKNNITPGSAWDDSVQKWAQDSITGWIKNKWGDKGLRLYNLSVAPPYQRLQALHYGTGNDNWANIVQSAVYITRVLKDPGMLPNWAQYVADHPGFGYSPGGDTADLQQYEKKKFFDGIDQLRLKDPSLDKLFTDLGHATASHGRAYREGPLLYDALFFNNWDSRIVPDNPNIYNKIGPGSLDGNTTTTTTANFADFHPKSWPIIYENGRIPLNVMMKVGSGNTLYDVQGGFYLRPDAGASFKAMEAAAARDGITLHLANAYRTLAQQADARRRLGSGGAAEAGHSDHGLGLAFDLLSPEAGNKTYWQEHDWVLNHAHEYGWINSAVEDPIWHEGGWAGETGHFSFYAGGATGGGSGASYGLPDSALDHKWVLAARGGSGNQATTTSTQPQGLDNTSQNKALAKQMAAQRGWTGAQWQSIRYIVEGHGGVPAESNWKGSATNPTSGAFGIGQRYLKPNPYTSAEDKQKYETSVRYQIKWFLSYIADRYGTPEAAWAYKESHGGY